VVSDAAAAGVADEALGPKSRPGYVLALRWTGLDADQDIVGASLRMMAADSVDAFVQAASTWVAPMQNMAVADRDGHIALIAPGRVPLRKPDNDLQGLAPAPGWDARYDWDGFLPVAVLPQVRDPERGYVANANQKITPPGYPHFISHQWALPFRHQRIAQMIDAKPKHSLDDLAAMHGDIRSLAAARLLPRLLQAKSGHPLAAAAMQALQGFDGTMAADRAAPLIFWAWNRHLSQRVLADEVGPAIYERMLGQRGYFDALEGVLTRDDGWWCDDKATPAVETCADQVNAAFTAALDELQALQGADVAAWQWGRAHQARSEHRPFSRVKALARWFEIRQPVGGDTYTVNVSRVGLKADATTGEYYLDEHGPSLRGLYDLADRSRSRIIHSTGQSGIPWSPQYRSFADTWRTGNRHQAAHRHLANQTTDQGIAPTDWGQSCRKIVQWPERGGGHGRHVTWVLLHRGDKTVAAMRHVNDVTLPIGAVAQCAAQRCDVHPQVDLFNDRCRPHTSNQLLFTDYLARVLKQHQKNIHGAPAHAQRLLSFKNQTLAHVKDVRAKSQHRAGVGVVVIIHARHLGTLA